MTRHRLFMAALVAVLALLVWLSSQLAAIRIYQVDECQNLYMARILATGHSSDFFTNASLFLLGPLSWMAQKATRSAEFFASARLLFFGVFWLNLFLMGLIAGGRLSSTRGIIALLAAATLAPLWDYGFEIRHDNVILAGVLITWWAMRVRPLGFPSYVLAGLLSTVLLFIAVKSIVYVLPLSFAVLTFPPPAHQIARWRAGLAWGVGAIVAVCLVRLCYGASGGWEIYLSVFRGVARYSTGGGGGAAGFAPWTTLARLFAQTPLLLAVTVAAFFAIVASFWQDGRAALSWNGNLPEALLLAGALMAVMVNPTPYPYNLVHVAPYAFIFAFRYVASIWPDIWGRANLRPLALAVLFFADLVPFGIATRRHWDWPNFRQESLMNLAEDLTDPAKDRVYDGIGMVPTRSSIDFHWYLHSLNVQSLIDGPGPHVRDMLAARTPTVLITSYRTDWLPREDHAFIREHYVCLADDVWVLGKLLPAGGGTIQIEHPGRYRISSKENSDLVGTYPEGWQGLLTPESTGCLEGTIDGVPLSNHPMLLTTGSHRIECATNLQPTIVWVGPKLDRVHRMGARDHHYLFVNGY